MFEEQFDIANETESTTSNTIISEESQHYEDDKLRHREGIDEKLNFYGDECKRYFMEKLKAVQQCIDETFYDCYLQEFMIGSLQCQVMFETFRKVPLTPVTVINLRNNHLEPFCCHSMVSFIEISSTLKELNLDGCKIGEEGIKILSPAFATSISIDKLNVANNLITDDGGEILVSFLMRNYVCRDLNLSRNMLGYKSAKIIGALLMETDTLKKLDISHNRLYEQYGIVAVMKGLMVNESLEYLDISWNWLSGQPFGKILSKSIKGARLKVLKIEFNNLTAFEFKKLALGIKYSETIEEVYVGGNFFTVDDDENLIKVFKTDSPLKLLSFGESFHLSHEAFQLLQEIKKSKPSIRVIYENIILPNPPRDVSMLDIFADRARYLALKPKTVKLRRNMGVFMTKLKNLETNYMHRADFFKLLGSFNANLDVELVNQYIEACSVYVDGKRLMNVHLMANHYLNRHPNVPKTLSKMKNNE